MTFMPNKELKKHIDKYHKQYGETPNERHARRFREEVDPLKKTLKLKEKQISEELHEAAKTCKHVDDGGFMYGFCIFCSEEL